MWQTFREVLETVVNLVALYMMLKPTEKKATKKPRNRKASRRKR